MAFITFYTPTYQRPKLLRRCIESVESQSVDDWQHLVIVDSVGLGVDGMFADVVNHTNKIEGEYVYFLQDDDKLADVDVVRDLRTALHILHRPPILMVKNKKRGNIYPTYWRIRPQICHVDLGSFVVRADVFKANAHKFGHHYSGDFDFINALWDEYGNKAQWFDRLVAEAMALGLGQPENQIAQRERIV